MKNCIKEIKPININDLNRCKLNIYIELLLKWQKKINLISGSTVKQIWERHIYDSLQLLPYLPEELINKKIVDCGSGAGFPGLMLSVFGRKDILLCEKSHKKASFLKEASRIMDIKVEIMETKVENLEKKIASAVIARAFAPLNKIIETCSPLLAPNAPMILLKGKNVDSEINLTKRKWKISFKKYPSSTSSDGYILTINKIKKLYD